MRIRKLSASLALFLVLGGTIGSRGAVAQTTEAQLRAQIQAVLVPSPYRMSPVALRGTIRYRVEEQGTQRPWTWPETGEQHAVAVRDGVELTVCESCGREPPPTAEELARYRLSNSWLRSDDRSIRRFARVAHSGPVDARMRRLVQAVQRRLSGPVTYLEYDTAPEALKRGGGDCTEFALLLAAAARARGIPTRVVAGLAYGSRFIGRAHSFGPHMWVQAWNGQRWVSYDAALGGFDAGHLAMAIGDGSPQSLQGTLQAIARMRVVDATGLLHQAADGASAQPTSSGRR